MRARGWRGCAYRQLRAAEAIGTKVRLAAFGLQNAVGRIRLAESGLARPRTAALCPSRACASRSLQLCWRMLHDAMLHAWPPAQQLHMFNRAAYYMTLYMYRSVHMQEIAR